MCNASPVLDLNEPQIDTFSHVFFSAVLRDTACEGQQTALTFPTGLQGKHKFIEVLPGKHVEVKVLLR